MQNRNHGLAWRCFLTTIQNTPRCSGVRDRKSELLRLTFEEGHRGFFAGVVQHSVVILCPKFGHSFDGKEGNKVYLYSLFTACQRFERKLEKNLISLHRGYTHKTYWQLLRVATKNRKKKKRPYRFTDRLIHVPLRNNNDLKRTSDCTKIISDVQHPVKMETRSVIQSILNHLLQASRLFHGNQIV